jgi:hypothetical protein
MAYSGTALLFFDNTIQRKICRHKRRKVTEGLRKLLDETIYNLYFSLSSTRVTKSKTMDEMGAAHRHGENDKCMKEISWEVSAEELSWET